MKKRKITRSKKSYHNQKSYQDELDLVLQLLEQEKTVENSLIERMERVFDELLDIYERELPFYFKDGVDGKRLNELMISLYSGSGNFETKLSKALDELERNIRTLETDYLTAWFIIDYEMTANATTKSIGAEPWIYLQDQEKIKEIIEKPWCDDKKTYMDRVWDATATMDRQLRKVIVEGVRRGWPLERMTQIFHTITGTVEWKARRLLRTETMAVWSKVTKEIYLENGIEYIEIIGDALCGGICLDYVGEVIPLAEAELGTDLPPYHPNCACSYCSYTEFTNTEEEEEIE